MDRVSLRSVERILGLYFVGNQRKTKSPKEHLVQYELEASKKRRELEAFISKKLKTKNVNSPIKPSQRIAEITENKAKERIVNAKLK